MVFIKKLSVPNLEAAGRKGFSFHSPVSLSAISVEGEKCKRLFREGTGKNKM